MKPTQWSTIETTNPEGLVGSDRGSVNTVEIPEGVIVGQAAMRIQLKEMQLRYHL
jgi:hypothetical protein